MFYPQLFRSGKIGTMEVKNRIVMPAMEVLAAGFSDAIFAGKVEEIYGTKENRSIGKPDDLRFVTVC